MDFENVSFLNTHISLMENSISTDLAMSQDQPSEEDEKTIQEELKKKLGPIKLARGLVKRKVTILIKQLLEVTAENETQLIPSLMEEISIKIIEIKNHDEQIEAVISASGAYRFLSIMLEEEMKSSASYHLQHKKAMSKFKIPGSSQHSSIHSDQSLGESDHQKSEIQSMLRVLSTRQEVKIPPLKCKYYSGESDRLHFRSFLLSFENIIGCRRDLTDAAKLQYLKSHLTGMAQKDIEHLPNIDSNYEVALTILKDLYLDEPFIIDSLFHNIYAAPSLDGKNLEDIRSFMSQLRAHLHELKEFSVDLLVEGAAGNSLLSHIVVDKLPKNFLREFKIAYKEEYPSVNTLIANYHKILKSMERSRETKTFFASSPPISKKKSSSPSSKTKKTSTYHSSHSTTNQYSNQERTAPSKNFTNSKKSFPEKKCKLCLGSHFMSFCSKYKTPASRKERCIQIGLCSCCSSAKHLTQTCPAKHYGLNHPCAICKSKAHVTPLCSSGVMSNDKSTKKETETNSSASAASPAVEISSSTNSLCINAGATTSENILPTISLRVRKGGKSVLIRCIVDNGSQGTYFSGNILSQLGIDINALPNVISNIKTFLGESSRILYSLDLEINICCDSYISVPVLVDPDLNIGFEVKGLMGAEFNVRQNGYHIADRFFYKGIHNDMVSNIDCLLGNNILYLMKHFKVVNCIEGSAYETCHGYIPFGPVRSFLTPSQTKTIFQTDQNFRIEKSSRQLTSPSLFKSVSKISDTILNSITNPSPSYFDPFSHTHTDVELDVGLENLYSIESIGINEVKDTGSIDAIFDLSFQNSIELREGRYHVEIPWYEDVLKEVPSNFKIALAALYRVKKMLHIQNLEAAYSDIFHQYVTDGIIEEIQVSPKDFSNYVWIPHRPVIKTAEQITTKVRPVFNCSLQVGNSPSLNQACYPGVDLMASLFRLLLHFRTNKYVVLADISKAFLQIRLKKEADRNKFCFFWEENGNLKTYRYTSIIFGLSVSPYILGAVIHHHAKKYDHDLCSFLLENNFYMDNFIFSHSSISTLIDVFEKTTSRLKEGGFDLCSWNSNSPELCSLFKEKGKIISHQEQEERVLGYFFDTSSDSIKLNNFDIDFIKTKRQLLSQISKVFDPLSLFLPVTIRGRLLMRKTWDKDLGWDDEVDLELKTSWEKLRDDLIALKEISFERSCFDTEDKDLSLNIFCDASPLCYGFVVYISSIRKGPRLFWSKGKVSPLKGRTLPCLELLSVFLAFKCLPQILDGFINTKFNSVHIFSDSQITLQWISKGGKKNKNIFIKNRIQDLRKMISDLKEEHHLSPLFHYVKSEENPADLITRGMSTSDFNKHFSFWNGGPEWLSYAQIYWPEQEWQTSTSNPSLVLSTTNPSFSYPIVKWDRFSSLHSLHRVISLLYKFSALVQKTNIDPDSLARSYCLKQMQAESFPKELAFLKKVKGNPSFKDQPPDLVNNLNLFLDEKDLIRSKGRLARSNYYDYDVLNPVLLGKNHYYTFLFIRSVHLECKHLGIQATLTNIRLKGFWITSARTSIKKVLSDCTICKRYNAFSFRYPRFTNFSKTQVELYRPFQHTGIDYTKHWWVKVKGSTQSQKMYILIYTCLNVRAVYLDLIPDMSSESFVKSFQRFVNRFGVPDVVYSDNARSFVQGVDSFESFVVSENGQEFLRKNLIKHRRVSLYSPWSLSQWERLLKVVKNCLVKTIGRSTIEYFQFITILSEITDAINSRPLTYTSSALDVIPLTPNCFLKPHSKTSMVWKAEETTSINTPSRNALIRSLRKSSDLFEEYRSRWYEEYLLSLREASRDLYQTNWNNLIKVDDVVLVRSPVKERPFWQLGIVNQLVYGDDGKVRSVFVKAPGGTINHHSIKNLYPLELSLTHSGSSKQNPVQNPSSHQVPVAQSNLSSVPASSSSSLSQNQTRSIVTSRPVRKAAAAARSLFIQSDSTETDSGEENYRHPSPGVYKNYTSMEGQEENQLAGEKGGRVKAN